MMGETTAQPNFYQRTHAAKKVMVLDLGFLGDTVHLFPALWMIRQAYPQAELHVIVSDHIISLMECVPWVDCVWGYSRFPRHATLTENLRTVRRLRKEGFDVVINLNGSDRSSWLAWLSGGRERLGRLPMDGGPWLWRSLFTEVVEHPYLKEPAYLQKCHCLRQAGFPSAEPEFHIEIAPKHLHDAGFNLAEAGTFFHLSPFSTADKKELPPEQTAELINALQEQFPERKLVLSCAPTERESNKMTALLKKLDRAPWRIKAGTLSLVQLAAVIQQSAVHLSGDTGPLHLAMMTGAPTVSWFRSAEGLLEWLPFGVRHRCLLGADANEGGLRGVATSEVIHAVSQLLKNEEQGRKSFHGESRSPLPGYTITQTSDAPTNTLG